MRKIQLFAIVLIALAIAACSGDKTSKVIELSTEEFVEKVVNFRDTLTTEWSNLNDRPVVVDFYADWCPPCKQIAPILDELSVKYANKIYIYKVNVDNAQELADFFGITSIPTMYFIPVNGEPNESIGALSKEEIEEKIKEIL